MALCFVGGRVGRLVHLPLVPIFFFVFLGCRLEITLRPTFDREVEQSEEKKKRKV